MKTKVDKVEMNNISYASTVGSMMNAMVCTRPHIASVVGLISWFMSNIGKEHWVVVKWILRYLRGTSCVCIRYGLGNSVF